MTNRAMLRATLMYQKLTVAGRLNVMSVLGKQRFNCSTKSALKTTT